MAVDKSENFAEKDDSEFCNCNVIHEDVVNYVRSGMLEQTQFEKLSMFFKAISDETRIKILYSLTRSKMCGDRGQERKACTRKSSRAHQLRVLRQAELVRSEKQGKVVYYMLSDDHVNTVFSNALEHIME